MSILSNTITIRTQLTLLIFATVLILLLVTAAIFFYLKAEDLQQQHQRDAETLSQVLSQDLTRVILLNELDVTNDMVQKISAFSDITHASVVSSTGTPILAFTRQGYSPVDLTLFSDKDNVKGEHMFISIEVSYSGTRQGIAYFNFRNTSFNQEFVRFLARLWFIAPVLLLFSFLVSFVAQIYFTRPILQLSRAVKNFKVGDPLRLDKQNMQSREITELFLGFETMAQNIADATGLIADQKERLHVMLESIADGVIATDINNVVTYVNPAAENILNIRENSVLQQKVADVFPMTSAGNTETIESILDETIITGNVYVNLEDTTVALKYGEIIQVQSTVSPIRDQSGNITGTIIVFQNVSEARALADKLQHQASHDPLTGLINRIEFERYLHELIKNNERNTNHALMYLDLDQFKLVNDTSGHNAGDALLIQLAGQLHGLLRDNDLVARLGGDEFVVLLSACDLNRATEIANNIIERFSQFQFTWEEHTFRIGVSIGLVPVNENQLTVEDLLRDADLACYVAKENGRNRVHVYRPEDTLMARHHNEMQWATLIRDAIDNDKLCLYAQHIRSMDSANKVNHFEVLVRYVDNNNNIRLPGEFLPAVERYGLAPELDRWVIRNVMENKIIVQELRSSRNMRVNINLSGHTLNDPSLVDYVSAMLSKANLPPRTICFEVTETAAVTNLGATAHFMKKMRLLGCEFALDDFGSGVSSFAYLKNLPIDYLKIDGSFVKDIDENAINRAMVNAINDIGHVMRIKTVAEYVKNPAVCEVLQTMDIDYVQGFYVHTPCPIIEIFKSIHTDCSSEVCK